MSHPFHITSMPKPYCHSSLFLHTCTFKFNSILPCRCLQDLPTPRCAAVPYVLCVKSCTWRHGRWILSQNKAFRCANTQLTTLIGTHSTHGIATHLGAGKYCQCRQWRQCFHVPCAIKCINWQTASYTQTTHLGARQVLSQTTLGATHYTPGTLHTWVCRATHYTPGCQTGAVTDDAGRQRGGGGCHGVELLAVLTELMLQQGHLILQTPLLAPGGGRSRKQSKACTAWRTGSLSSLSVALPDWAQEQSLFIW